MGLNILLPLIFTSLTLQLASGQGNAISCTAGNFTKCASAKVTCHFNLDVKQNRKNFNVVQYPYKQGASSSDAGNYVLVCNWGEGESLECKVEDGYTFDKQVGNSLTLGIPDVKTSVAGVYVCQLVPDGGIPLETCKLDVQDASATCGACPNATCHDVCANQDYIIAVLVIVVLVFLMMIVFGTAVAIYIKLNYRWEKKTSGNVGSHNSGTCCGLTLTRLSDDTESARSHKRSSKATGNLQEAAALLDKKGEDATSQAPAASPQEPPTPETQGHKAKNVTKLNAGQASNTPAPTTGHGGEDDGGGQSPASSGGTGTGSFEEIQSAGNQGEGKQRSHRLESGPTMSPPEKSLPNKGALNMSKKILPLEEDQSDSWQMEQVCQWLTKEGFGEHAQLVQITKC